MKSKSGYFEIYLLKITNNEMISIICCETVSTKTNCYKCGGPPPTL